MHKRQRWLLLLILSPVDAWHNCSSSSSDVCPTGNTCCHQPSTNSYRCLSGKDSNLGTCCGDAGSRTGCGYGFQCAVEEEPQQHDDADNSRMLQYCARIDPDNALLPARVPRYQLCSLPPRALMEVYGLTMMMTTSATAAGDGPVAAYLSNLGSLDVDDVHTAVDTVWIVVHGSERNADDYLCCAQQAAVGQNTNLWIVAPWFLAPQDNVTGTNDNSNSSQPQSLWLRWAEDGPIPHTWRYGADDVTGANISSYAVLDAFVDRFMNATQFPSLRRIVVAGHSAGGQYVQRWALLSDHPNYDNNNNNNNHNVSLRTVVANPKSFAWLDERRILEDGVILRPPDRDAIDRCPTYNEWEWGLQNSTRDLVAPYKDRALRDSGGGAALAARYAKRNVVYLAGEHDVLPNGDCEDLLQGRFRLERSAHFYVALQEICGGSTVSVVHHRLVVAGVHHDHCLMFQSPEGRKALFGNLDSDNAVNEQHPDGSNIE